jgi:FkbM family methyltransferase
MDVTGASLRLIRRPVIWILSAVADVSIRAAELAAATTRLLPRFLWEPRPLVAARRQGLLFALDLRDNVQRTLYFTGWYERRYLTWIIDRLRRDDVFVDVGAHIGIHTLTVARRLMALGGGTVLAFEPSRHLATALQLSLQRNGLSNVTVVRTGLGRGRGAAQLRVDPKFHREDAAVRSFVAPGDVVEEVPVISFDEWNQGLCRVDLVKIDVEGAELEVLEGMRETLRLMRPRMIGVELRSYILDRARVSADDIAAFMNDIGYVILHTDDMEGNFIFVQIEA